VAVLVKVGLNVCVRVAVAVGVCVKLAVAVKVGDITGVPVDVLVDVFDGVTEPV
jgi:hypothetical protein